MESAISRETAIGIAVTAVALVAMVFDHLLGDDPGLEDPIAFVVAAVLTIACAIIVFGIVVPRMTGISVQWRELTVAQTSRSLRPACSRSREGPGCRACVTDFAGVFEPRPYPSERLVE